MRLSILFFSLLCIFSACRNQPSEGNSKLPAQPSETMQTNAQLPSDFPQFYSRFHSDSLYQVSHIHWPLSGKFARQVDSSHVDLESTKWQPESWRFQQAVDFSKGEFVQDLEPLGDVMVIERIRTPGNEFSLERRFAKRPDDEWELIYYKDMFESE